jgi:hypothetical protein
VTSESIVDTEPVSRPRRESRLPAKYHDFVNTDTLVQQLTALNDEELGIVITPTTPLSSTIEAITPLQNTFFVTSRVHLPVASFTAMSRI